MQEIIESSIAFMKSLHSAEGLRQIVQTGGLITLIGIIFAETGLLAGFFLPGDSLLVTAGIFAASDGRGGPPLFNVFLLLSLLTIAAVLGDQVGYLLGRKTGPFIFRKQDSMFFKRRHLEAAQDFYRKKGGSALIIARFVPILRTFVPFAAGMAHMNYNSFVRFNAVGGLLWIFSMVLIGYGLGHTPLADQLHKIILLVVFVSILPLMSPLFKKVLRGRAKPGSIDASL